eukprot:11205369-Lingulodinium_polyedra.AAC.1
MSNCPNGPLGVNGRTQINRRHGYVHISNTDLTRRTWHDAGSRGPQPIDRDLSRDTLAGIWDYAAAQSHQTAGM